MAGQPPSAAQVLLVQQQPQAGWCCRGLNDPAGSEPGCGQGLQASKYANGDANGSYSHANGHADNHTSVSSTEAGSWLQSPQLPVLVEAAMLVSARGTAVWPFAVWPRLSSRCRAGAGCHPNAWPKSPAEWTDEDLYKQLQRGMSGLCVSKLPGLTAGQEVWPAKSYQQVLRGLPVL